MAPTYQFDNGLACGVCQESFDNQSVQLILECKHKFCEECLNLDCRLNNAWKCPTCRKPFETALEVKRINELNSEDANLLGTPKLYHEDQCLICMNPLLNKSFISCGHALCLDCLFKWIQLKQECPLCRQKMNQKPLSTAKGLF